MRGFIGGLVIGLVAGVIVAVTVEVRAPAVTGISLPIQEPAATVPAVARIRWDMSSAFPGDAQHLGELAKRTVDRIRTISQGAIAIRFHEPEALVPALKVFDAVSTGIVESAFSRPAYSAEKVPALHLFSAVPFGPTANEYVAWMEFGGGRELFEKIYHRHGVHSIVCGVSAPAAAGWFKKEIATTADLNGLNMAIAGLGGKVIEKFGVRIRLMSADEIQRAMKSGDIDAAAYSLPATDRSLNLQESAGYYYFPGWFQQAGLLELMVNLKHWEKLSPSQHATIETVCGDNFRHGLAASEAQQFEALKSLVLERVEVKRWPPEILDALEKAWHEVARELAESDSDFRQVWRSMQKFREDYGIWRDLGYL
jgi:TRAP-type mannitol/chloroaromatic compound transport system substrate-binding protein